MGRRGEDKAQGGAEKGRSSPPFTALRAVEAAARHRSFTSAARELNVTHSAVSQAIRRLEADLGTPLFARRGVAMEPSEAALRLARSYAEAAEVLESTIRDVSGGQDLGVLRLATGDGPLRGWLAGRLDRLADALPDLRLALAGPGPAEGDAELLLTARPQPADQLIGAVEVLPLCSADAAFAGGLRRAGDVLGAPLLEARPGVWTDWARRQGLADPPAARLHADQDDLMAAAARGEGVALGDQFMAEAPVLAGDLIALPFAAAADDSVVLRWRPGVAGREAAERLVMGLRLEMARGAALIRAASRSRASRASS